MISKVKLNFEVANYLIKTATTQEEIYSALKLRYDVFLKEKLGKTHPEGIDTDRYDQFFDHLIVIDQKKNIIIATYRLLVGDAKADFYSRSEFNLDELTQRPGLFMEMGRACVHIDYRRSIVMNLLWRGIAEYLKLSGAKYLIGCGSVYTEDVRLSALLTDYLIKNNFAITDVKCEPLAKYKFIDFALHLEKLNEQKNVDHAEAIAVMPSLLRSYLRAGARLLPEPAWDREFKCIDYLVLLDKHKIDATYGKKYDLELKNA